MKEIVEVEQRFYVLATSTLVDDRTRVLKNGDAFAVLDRFGDIQSFGPARQGLYCNGTRFLSYMSLKINGMRPLLLGSTFNADNALLSVDLTNPDIHLQGNRSIRNGSIHLFRSKFLWQNVCYEYLRATNFGLSPVDLILTIEVDADFADIFEARGMTRKSRGRVLPAFIKDDAIVRGYEGLDGKVRKCRIHCSSDIELSTADIVFTKHLEPRQEASFSMAVACEIEESIPAVLPFEQALDQAMQSLRQGRSHYCDMATSNHSFDLWLNRSLSDLCTMTTETSYGPYPYAGVPWFSTVFGRDGMITALEALWVNPGIARGVLRYLAAYQAKSLNAEQDAEPGKILHEVRGGEMAALGEIPFGCYYGSVDSTPLFIMLAGAYYQRTGDKAFAEFLWPHVRAGLEWIDRYGDLDGDGFVEYQQHSSKGLLHQGWKDSQDSVFHADGTLAEGPIALCEVQGYVYAAKQAASQLAEVLGFSEDAGHLRQQALRLQRHFEDVFWCEDLSTYALALDGRKKLCRVRTSNAGHCLFTGIASSDHAEKVAHLLLQENFFSGWGIRTVDAREARYNPMSYHNGSVWPHDNALISAGLSQYGMKHLSLQVLTGLFNASATIDLHRLPELICGFRRRAEEGPTLYPVACSPQAWAAGAICLLIQSCLGLSIDVPHKQVLISEPQFPPYLHEIVIRHLKVGKNILTLAIRGRSEDMDVDLHVEEGSVQPLQRIADRQWIIPLQ